MIYTVTLNPAVDKELTVPALILDAVLRAQARRVDWGGKGFNVSRLLRGLGAESVALGFAGGRSGRQMRDGLEALGIATDFVWIAEETRTNVTIVTDPASHYIKVNEPGPTVTAVAQAALRQKISELARPDDWWVLGGSLPPGVGEGVYAQLIEMIQAAGGRVILDSSGAALRLGCAARPFLIKPNDVEARALAGLPVGSRAETAAAARAIRAQGAANVIISMGKGGAVWTDGKQTWHAVSPPITERNPIGAGDSMVGGVVWGLSRGYEMAEALRWGVACGAATAGLPGTAVGGRRIIEDLLPQVHLTKI